MGKYIVFSLRVANNLVAQGYEIIGRGVNIKNPKYQVFYFEDTLELRRAMDKILSSNTTNI